MRNIFLKLFAVLICFITISAFLIVKPSIVVSQEVIDVGGNAPRTTDVVKKALENGASPEEAAQAGADFLDSIGYVGYVVIRDGTVSVECNNGSRVDIPLPIPTAGPTVSQADQPTPPTQKSFCEEYPQFCPGEPDIDITPPETPTPTQFITPTQTPTRTPSPTPTSVPTQTPTATPVPPTPTSTPTPTQTPTATPTPTQTPTPSPTPTLVPFNPAACKCDGIEYSNLFSGQTATITSFGKVEGLDTSKAIVKDQKFFFAEGGETVAKIIGKSNTIPSTVVSSTPEKIRFQSQWKFTLPQLKPGATYRIWSQINCQPKNQELSYTSAAKTVLGTNTSQPRSFIQRMLDFLNNLFRGQKSAVTKSEPTPAAEPGVGIGIILEEPVPTGRKSLQLQTVYPVEVYEKSCSFIKFRYDQAAR